MVLGCSYVKFELASNFCVRVFLLSGLLLEEKFSQMLSQLLIWLWYIFGVKIMLVLYRRLYYGCVLFSLHLNFIVFFFPSVIQMFRNVEVEMPKFWSLCIFVSRYLMNEIYLPSTFCRYPSFLVFTSRSSYSSWFGSIAVDAITDIGLWWTKFTPPPPLFYCFAGRHKLIPILFRSGITTLIASLLLVSDAILLQWAFWFSVEFRSNSRSMTFQSIRLIIRVESFHLVARA